MLWSFVNVCPKISFYGTNNELPNPFFICMIDKNSNTIPLGWILVHSPSVLTCSSCFVVLPWCRHYDVHQLFGIIQIKEGTSNKAITDSGELDTSDVLGITRHPWYLAAILLIWVRQLDASAIFVNVILASYLIVEIYIEEKKLVREFGEKYLTYQKRVSMLIPYK